MATTTREIISTSGTAAGSRVIGPGSSSACGAVDTILKPMSGFGRYSEHVIKCMLLPLAVALTIVGCRVEERPDYGVVENTVPAGGPTLEYSASASYVNVDSLSASLSGGDRAKFTESLAWFGTESTFALERLAGKTASQVVDVVNCLKRSTEERDAEKCF